MTDIASDSAEAFDKLNKITGGTIFWLDPVTYGLIETACGAVAPAGAVGTPGPATTTEFTLTGPYKFPADNTIVVTFADPVLVVSVGITESFNRRSELALALEAALIAALPGYNVEMSAGTAYGSYDFTITGASSTITSVEIVEVT